MDNKKFRMEFEVHYHEVNPYEKATPLTILHYLEDVAIAHSEAVGQGIGKLKSNNQAWILNRWHLEMDRYPMLSEKVVIETWSSGFERFYATRDFLIIDMHQTVIGRAMSLWIFYNTESKRPSRIPSDFQEAYGVTPKKAIEKPFQQLQRDVEQEQEGANEQVFTVRRRDIDTNGHVNNANYLEWMLEVVPEDIYHNKHLAALEIIYKKATTYGTSINSKCHIEYIPVNIALCKHVILGDRDSQELAIAKTVWVPGIKG